MAHIGILCPPATGHLNPMTTLGRELTKRGHQVSLFGFADAKSKIVEGELEFCEIGKSDFPPGSLRKHEACLGRLKGLAALQYTISLIQQEAIALLQDAPDASFSRGIEIFLIDQATLAGSTVAETLGVPFISVATGVMVNQASSIPPSFTPWTYNTA